MVPPTDPVSLIVWGALTILIPVLVAWLFILARKALVAGETYAKAHTTESQQRWLWDLANQAVLFAEQSGLADALKASGTAKYEQATQFVTDQLEKQHINIDPDALDGVINAAVMQQFNQPAVIEAKVVQLKGGPPPPVPPFPEPTPAPTAPPPSTV